MRLTHLFRGITGIVWKGNSDPEVEGVAEYSKAVYPGYLFSIDQTRPMFDHIEEAIKRGAVALLTSSYCPRYANLVQLIYPDVRSLLSIILDRYYENPTKTLSVIGVTGTCGKTTTTFLLHHLFTSRGEKSALIGSNGWFTVESSFPARLATPNLAELMQLLAKVRDEGGRYVFMEATSMGIDQGRERSIPFKAAIFTNLTQDHLDYHGTMERYAEAKSKLFSRLDFSACAIINGDDMISPFMASRSSAPVIYYGLDPSYDLYASQIASHESGMRFYIHSKEDKVLATTSLIGEFNVYNILAATAVALREGISLKEVAKSLSSFVSVPGRLERIDHRKGVTIFVDYAHKPAALEKVLLTLKKIKKKRVITLFGCGGERDRSKRPLMGAISERLSDITIITSDNPRHESPQQIMDEIAAGFRFTQPLIEGDRRKAILTALEIASKGDILLIAGKGSETYQIWGDQKIPFDDREIVRNG